MAQPFFSGRKIAARPSRGQQPQVMHHMLNEDDSSSCYDQRGNAFPAAARSQPTDDRVTMVDFSSAHESRPNNLDYGTWRGNVTLEVGNTARHMKMLNEERERREKNVGTSGAKGQSSSAHIPGTAVPPAAFNHRHRPPPPRVPDASATMTRQKLANSPAVGRQLHMGFSDLDDASSDGRHNNFPRSLANTYADHGSYSEQVMQGSPSVDGDSTANSLATDDMPDQTQLVARLMEIRDYMHQAMSMLDTVRNSQDASSLELSTRLEELLAQLQSEEKKYLTFLRKLLATQKTRQHGSGGDSHRMHDEGSDDQHEDTETDATTTDLDTGAVAKVYRMKPNNRGESVAEHQVLLEKILQQREKMKLLLSQQEQLNQLQHETARRLVGDPHASQRNNSSKTSVTSQSTYNPAQDGDEGEEEEDECSTIIESTASAHEQHRLENKLRDLRDKKKGIDELLSDLKSLTSSRRLLNNGVSSQQLNDSMRASSVLSTSAEKTAHEAERVLQVMEKEHKLKKLRELHDKLDQLRQLSNIYPSGNESTPERAVRASGGRPVSKPQQPVQTDDRSSIPLSPDIDEFEEMRARIYALGTESDNISGDMDVEDIWKGNADVLEKVRQLKAAKERMHRLQDLVNQAQAIPGLTSSLPAEIAAELTRQTSGPSEASGGGATGSSGARAGHDVSGGQVEELYSSKMQQQREELAQLTAERQKLLIMQEQLYRLQDTLVQTSQEVVSQPVAAKQDTSTRRVRDVLAQPALDATSSGSAAVHSTNVKSPFSRSASDSASGSGGGVTDVTKLKSPSGEPPVHGRSPSDHSGSHIALVHAASESPANTRANSTKPPQQFEAGITGRRVVEPAVSVNHAAAASPAGVASLMSRHFLTKAVGESARGGAPKRSSEASSQVKTSSAMSAAATAAAQVTFQDPIETVMTNEELYDRMRQQRMLREELRKKKKVPTATLR